MRGSVNTWVMSMQMGFCNAQGWVVIDVKVMATKNVLCNHKNKVDPSYAVNGLLEGGSWRKHQLFFYDFLKGQCHGECIMKSCSVSIQGG